LSGYTYYGEVDTAVDGDEDGSGDCQPTVEERCDTTEIRRASDSACINPATYDCTSACGESGGTFGESGRY